MLHAVEFLRSLKIEKAEQKREELEERILAVPLGQTIIGAIYHSHTHILSRITISSLFDFDSQQPLSKDRGNARTRHASFAYQSKIKTIYVLNRFAAASAGLGDGFPALVHDSTLVHIGIVLLGFCSSPSLVGIKDTFLLLHFSFFDYSIFFQISALTAHCDTA